MKILGPLTYRITGIGNPPAVLENGINCNIILFNSEDGDIEGYEGFLLDNSIISILHKDSKISIQAKRDILDCKVGRGYNYRSTEVITESFTS